MYLTQAEADNLMMMEKIFVDNSQLNLGEMAIDIRRELSSIDNKEIFHIDIWRCGYNLSRIKFQNRSRIVNHLLRVDLAGPPHHNPDNTIIQCPHIHIYREGYDDKWAWPLSEIVLFRDISNIVSSLEDFARFCHIINIPQIQYSYV